MGLQESVLVERSAVTENPTRGIFGRKFHPAFIKVALLRHQAVPDPAVLDDGIDGDGLSRRQCELLPVNWGDELAVTLADAENVDRDSVFQELPRLLHLVLVTIKLGDRRIGAQPAVR